MQTMCLYVHNYIYAHVYVCMISYLDSLFRKSQTIVKKILNVDSRSAKNEQ